HPSEVQVAADEHDGHLEDGRLDRDEGCRLRPQCVAEAIAHEHAVHERMPSVERPPCGGKNLGGTGRLGEIHAIATDDVLSEMGVRIPEPRTDETAGDIDSLPLDADRADRSYCGDEAVPQDDVDGSAAVRAGAAQGEGCGGGHVSLLLLSTPRRG